MGSERIITSFLLGVCYDLKLSNPGPYCCPQIVFTTFCSASCWCFACLLYLYVDSNLVHIICRTSTRHHHPFICLISREYFPTIYKEHQIPCSLQPRSRAPLSLLWTHQRTLFFGLLPPRVGKRLLGSCFNHCFRACLLCRASITQDELERLFLLISPSLVTFKWIT